MLSAFGFWVSRLWPRYQGVGGEVQVCTGRGSLPNAKLEAWGSRFQVSGLVFSGFRVSRLNFLVASFRILGVEFTCLGCRV